MKEARLKKLHTVLFQLYDVLEKANLSDGEKWLPGIQGKGGELNI